ncbi:hypothetical protein T484DRAFT_1846886 [Baffinella frigidus]|nr:hypothetical protein T484DRAFT_1846886 [Cryptophyta sp. CCMP2293]
MSGARNLWRRCVKLTHMMPKAQSDYYYRYAKQNFINYDREDDPEHISFLVTRGHTHVDYIEQKYSLDKQTGTNWNATRADMAANTQKGQGAADAPDGQPGEAPAPSPPPDK